MCGIFGMIGDGALTDTARALKYLEYRGYDSVGIAEKRERLNVYKTAGRVETLTELLPDPSDSHTAIGHTRWATHGEVKTENAHPFLSYGGSFAIVHNGVIENYKTLRNEISQRGVTFSSDTDSETVAHLLELNYRGDVLKSVIETAKMLSGSFAVAVVNVHDDVLYAIKNKSPLVVGSSKNGKYICSDIRCVSHWADSVAVAPDKTVVAVSSEGIKFYDFNGKPVETEFFAPEKAEAQEIVSGDMMLKEIMEIPQKLRECKQGYFDDGGLKLSKKFVKELKRIYLIGCGTAYNSGLSAAAVARNFLDIDVIPVIASEFIYDRYLVDDKTLAVCISQSGETADTIRAAEKVCAQNGVVYSVTNTITSSLCFVSSKVSNIYAGGEFAVASTKAYNCQLLTLLLIFADIAQARGSASEDALAKLRDGMDALPAAVDEVLSQTYEFSCLANEIKNSSAVFFLGRTVDYPTACEGSLKLKEISYIHSEAYPAGELKHGTLALMEEGVTVVALSCDGDLTDKMATSIKEVETRGARVIKVSPYISGKDSIKLPVINKLLYGVLSVVPLQLLAYFTAKHLGRDVDKPRNLAKSVTVE